MDNSQWSIFNQNEPFKLEFLEYQVCWRKWSLYILHRYFSRDPALQEAGCYYGLVKTLRENFAHSWNFHPKDLIRAATEREITTEKANQSDL